MSQNNGTAPQPQSISIIEMLSLAEKAARDAREAICVQHQIDIGIAAAKTQLAVAGAGVLGQIMNGQARVLEHGHPNDPAVQESKKLHAFTVQNLGNLLNIAGALQPIHAEMVGGKPSRV